jgi:hypothetical protein
MQQDTVFMRSPEGEVREVAATPETLTPLMAQGWHQHHPQAKLPAAPRVAEQEEK